MNLEWMETGSLEGVDLVEAERICRVCSADHWIDSKAWRLEVRVGDKHAAFEITKKPGGSPMVPLKQLARFLRLALKEIET